MLFFRFDFMADRFVAVISILTTHCTTENNSENENKPVEGTRTLSGNFFLKCGESSLVRIQDVGCWDANSGCWDGPHNSTHHYSSSCRSFQIYLALAANLAAPPTLSALCVWPKLPRGIHSRTLRAAATCCICNASCRCRASFRPVRAAELPSRSLDFRPLQRLCQFPPVIIKTGLQDKVGQLVQFPPRSRWQPYVGL